MPRCDGFQVIEALRQQEQATGEHLPVIALTARAMASDRERCLAAGMDDYLSKPVGSAELFAAIERLLPSATVHQPIQPHTGDGTGLLDPVVLLAACGDDADGLRRMCEGFRDYVPSQLAEAGYALRAQDAPRLCAAAHKLCGLLSAVFRVSPWWPVCWCQSAKIGPLAVGAKSAVPWWKNSKRSPRSSSNR
jgi:hypothetical protein